MFWEIFVSLCAERGLSPNKVAQTLSISSGSVTNWKRGRTPQSAILVKIADYFGVSVSYLLGEATQPKESAPMSVILDSDRICMVPLFGSVSAGFGVIPVDAIEDYVPIYFRNPIEAQNTICVRVQGDSMYPTIEDGDIVQVSKQTSVNSGDIAVVLVDSDEALVKRIVYGETFVELQSINPMYKAVTFAGKDALRVQILGRVNKIIKTV